MNRPSPDGSIPSPDGSIPSPAGSIPSPDASSGVTFDTGRVVGTSGAVADALGASTRGPSPPKSDWLTGLVVGLAGRSSTTSISEAGL